MPWPRSRRNSFDVIALDHYLTTGTGLDFIRRFGAATGCVPPVVYVTGSTEINVGIAALKAGAADFVPKTVGDDFLVMLGSSLEQAVGQGAPEAAKRSRRRRDPGRPGPRPNSCLQKSIIAWPTVCRSCRPS